MLTFTQRYFLLGQAVFRMRANPPSFLETLMTFQQTFRAMAAAMLLAAPGAVWAKDTLMVAHDKWIGYSGFFVAQAKGFFAESDLEVKTTQFSGPGDTLPPLVGGHADISLTTLHNLSILAGQGETSVKAVYLLDTSNGADAIVAKSPIDSIQKLKGAKVAVTTGEVNHLLLIAALQKAGLKESDITLVNMNADDAGAAFLAGRVDAAVTWEPWVSKALSAGGKTVFTSADTPDLILDAVVVTDKTVAARGAVIKRFIAALDKGVAYLRAHPEESHAIIGKALDVSAEDAAGMLAGDKIYDVAQNRALLADGGQGHVSLKAVSDFLVSQTLISKPVEGASLLSNGLLP
jgi:NitT/TauT family transport system substrate-binding protein